jgi:hypothetical protein
MGASISGRFISMVIVCPFKSLSQPYCHAGLGSTGMAVVTEQRLNAARETRAASSGQTLFGLRGLAVFDHIAGRKLEHCRIGFRAGGIDYVNHLRAFSRVLARDRQIYL